MHRFQNGATSTAWRNLLVILGGCCWIVLINLVYMWLIQPLVLDLALLGVFATAAIVIVWLASIPKGCVRAWTSFTIFGVLLACGLSGLTADAGRPPVILAGILCVLLIVLTCWFGRIRFVHVLVPAVVLCIANVYVPIRDWPFLTHFSISFDERVPLSPYSFAKRPLLISHAGDSAAVVTMRTVGRETGSYLHQQNEMMSLTDTDGRIQLHPATPAVLSQIDPNAVTGLTSPLFPAIWTVSKGHLFNHLHSALGTDTYASLTGAFANTPVNMTAITHSSVEKQQTNWAKSLQRLGVQPNRPVFSIDNGKLMGTFHGRKVDVPVQGSTIVAQGAFTRAGSQELLVEGLDLLQVVALDGTPHVVSTYHVNLQNPIAGNLFVAPIDATNRDVIYLNGEPSRILSVQPTGSWRVLYTAPNPHLQFMAAVRFQGEQAPEILTLDSSYMRTTSGASYLTSYRYEQGQLVRNWRIYRQDVSSVISVQFHAPSPPALVAVLGGQHIAVLRRQEWPMVPIVFVLFGMTVVGGFAYRLRGRWTRHA